MPDPTQMTDEELEAAIANPPEEEQEEEIEVEVPETAEKPAPKGKEKKPESETEEPEAPETEEPEGEEKEEPEEEPKISRREALRVRDLLKKQSQPERKMEAPKALDYEKALEADPETLKRLEDDRQKAMQATYEQGMQQAAALQFNTRLEIDAPRIMTKYPLLDEESEKFKESAAADVNGLYLQLAGYEKQEDGNVTVRNPGLRYAPFVEAIFNLAREIGTDDVETKVRTRTKQRASTGLRPDGSSPKRVNINKDPSLMTDEELDAAMAARGVPNPTAR